MVERKELQKQVRKSASRPTIRKKELLKITDKYERLLDQLMNPAERTSSDSYSEEETPSSEVVLPLNESTNTVRRWEEEEGQGGQGGVQKKMVLKLSGVRGLGIMDYQDEFMSHYE